MYDRDVARFECADRQRPRREHFVEHGRLQRRDQEARLAAVTHSFAPGEQPGGARRVVAVAAETLLAVAIGHALAPDLREARRRARGRGDVEATHCDREAVAAQMPGSEFVRMASRLQHAGALEFQPQRALRIEIRYGEPLARDRNAILAAGVADLARRDAGRARKPAHDLLGGALALFDTNQRMAALAARRVGGNLVDLEVLGSGGAPGHAGQSSESWLQGANDRRWSGEGPRRRSASRCSGVA